MLHRTLSMRCPTDGYHRQTCTLLTTGTWPGAAPTRLNDRVDATVIESQLAK